MLWHRRYVLSPFGRRCATGARLGTRLFAFWDSRVDTAVCPEFAQRFHRCLANHLATRHKSDTSAAPGTDILAAVHEQAKETLIGAGKLDLPFDDEIVNKLCSLSVPCPPSTVADN